MREYLGPAKRRLGRLATLWATAAILAGAAPSAQEAARPPQQPVFRVEANYVRVDVYVTDGDQPVRDLTADDFVVSEDGAAQSITAFEHVEIRGRVDGPPGREPQSVAEAREMARDPRARVFVLFLDTLHTGVGGSHRMQRALVTMLDRILGPNDLVGIMTPDMSAADVTFGRRTDSIEAMLSKYWTWGRRDQVIKLDPVEQNYEICYPDAGDTAGIAREMIDRRREQLTLAALRDLSVFLRGVREERKAVIAVSDGWLLYEPNRALAERQFKDAGRTLPVPGVGPTGGLTSDVRSARSGVPMFSCKQDRIQLSMLDNRRDFMDLFDIANRANVSFYPVDSRGLPVFDEGLERPVAPVAVDQRRLSNRIESLRTLAINTDGFAVVNNNDIESGLKRIADDVTSYYLLGYYSTNARLDGKFRSISVKVRRPGVTVRHRRGYRAATDAEVAGAASPAANRSTTGEGAAPDALQAAFGTLAPDRREVRFRSVAGWLPVAGSADATSAGARVWAVGEIDSATAKAPEWSAGGEVEARLTDAAGATVATATTTLGAGARTFATDFGESPVSAGDYAVRLRVKPAAGGLPLSEVARLQVPSSASGAASPRVFRRGPTTGGIAVATADRRFRRTERIRVEWPQASPIAERRVDLVGRNGRVMAVPVTVTERPDPGGAAPIVVAELALAPLAEGEYALVLRSGTATATGDAVVALRIVP
jgi:VWFA-related protein